ncbi:MAG: IclR family transcriptional regulator [Hungatella sp.]|nr:IclR family transcriptional regulator [Hungatella sp.]
MGMEGEVKVKSLKKALDILSYFSEKPLLGVTEISTHFGINKSSVHNILSTFEAAGYVEQDKESGKYRLGMRIFNLSRALGDNYAITKIAMPYLQELANRTGQRVYLAINYQMQVLYLEAMYPKASFHLIRNMLGSREELYCTGLGKAMLAYMPAETVDAYLTRSFHVYTDHTIVEPDKLREELGLIRQRGYAVDNMEREFGIRCVAIPIHDRNRKVYAAISVSGHATFVTDEKISEWAILIKEYVMEIEKRL